MPPDCPTPLKANWYFIQDNARMYKTQDSMATAEDLVENRLHELPTHQTLILSKINGLCQNCKNYNFERIKTDINKSLEGAKLGLCSTLSRLDSCPFY